MDGLGEVAECGFGDHRILRLYAGGNRSTHLGLAGGKLLGEIRRLQ